MAQENYTKYAILGLLTTECKTGYDIKQMIDRSLTYFWKISYGQIYPTLKKLVEEELATVTTTAQEGKPDKKEYEITEKGKQFLQQWLHESSAQLPIEKNELLLKLFFSRHQKTDTVIFQVEQYKVLQKEKWEALLAIEESILGCNSPDLNYWLMTIDYGKHVTSACIEWCERTLAQLHEKKEE
ncbi:PadR family transcriptional regulator [Alkalihalobacterium bogoriense]|uniref:PadR family transcriptional regulator n=1 Tax=Alkalihalobacterium bogoriense TaxID=246272 RepID=UPI00047B1372|nr:PadR family transcriptional regulator [Alkalihalobacterium bogoriense]